jgi:hypothetical protein
MTAVALRAPRRWRAGPVIGLAGLILTAIGFVVDPRQAYASWLTALAAGLSAALGVVILIAIAHVSGARWFDPLRALALNVAGTMPLFGLLFLVLLSGLGRVYPWVHTRGASNASWLNVPWFVVRAAVYFAIWIVVSLLLRRWAAPDLDVVPCPPSPRERALAAVALPALGLSLTFAGFDWLMSLAPGWVSTAFGVYWFAGGFVAALALVTLLAAVGGLGATRAPISLGPRQAYALGALMLTFAVFWAYIAYSQYFIIWIANVPAEVAWYIPRLRGAWGGIALVVVVGQFLLPLLVLLFYAAKVSPRVVGVVAALVLVMHYLDTYWLVLPAVHADAPHPHWLDLSALAAVGGTAAAWTTWLARR